MATTTTSPITLTGFNGIDFNSMLTVLLSGWEQLGKRSPGRQTRPFF